MPAKLLIRTAIGAGYLALVHAAILLHWPAIALGSLATASGVNAATGLIREHATGVILFWSGLCAAMLALAVAAALGFSDAVQVVLFPSVIVNFAAFLFFGRTLLPGKDPLITQVIRVDRPEVPSDMAAYSRGLTAVWTGFFAITTVAAVVLGLRGDVVAWSWLANVVNPVSAALLFFGEHLFRPARLGGPASPLRTVRLMLQAPIWSSGRQ